MPGPESISTALGGAEYNDYRQENPSLFRALAKTYAAHCKAHPHTSVEQALQGLAQQNLPEDQKALLLKILAEKFQIHYSASPTASSLEHQASRFADNPWENAVGSDTPALEELLGFLKLKGYELVSPTMDRSRYPFPFIFEDKLHPLHTQNGTPVYRRVHILMRPEGQILSYPVSTWASAKALAVTFNSADSAALPVSPQVIALLRELGQTPAANLLQAGKELGPEFPPLDQLIFNALESGGENEAHSSLRQVLLELKFMAGQNAENPLPTYVQAIERYTAKPNAASSLSAAEIYRETRQSAARLSEASERLNTALQREALRREEARSEEVKREERERGRER